MKTTLYIIAFALCCSSCTRYTDALLSGARQFIYQPTQSKTPQLVLITGCTGTGKSTFGMSVALGQGTLKCISTDSVRQVMRSFKTAEELPALHRSSYSGNGDPIKEYLECCEVLEESVDSLVSDALRRGVSLVMEGVHLPPSNKLIDKWRASGGIALGCVLVIKDAEKHKDLIFKRGELTGKGADQQVKAFSRIRSIQSEMIRRANEHNWLMIEQRLEPDPIDIVSDVLSAPNHDPAEWETKMKNLAMGNELIKIVD